MPARVSLKTHLLQNTALLALSALFLPLNTAILLLCLLYRRLFPPPRPVAANRKTVLVSGLAMSKGLTLSRLFSRAGHRVIGVDFTTAHFAHSRVPSNGRFSAALDAYYTVTSPEDCANGRQQYISDMLTIILREKVDLFVCVSGVATTVEDAYLKAVVEKAGSCRVVQLQPATCELLHEKHTFISACAAAGLAVPVTRVVRSHAEAVETLGVVARENPAAKFIMKSIWLDDVSRGDMTLLPRPTQKETEAFVAALDMGEEKPWVVQEFVRGGEEYCTHAVIINGDVTAFAACRSSDMLMRYQALPATHPLTVEMLAFTRKLVRTLEGGKLTGQVSVDFLVERDQQGQVTKMLPIESNPRTHTAVILFRNKPKELADAYLELLQTKKKRAPVASDESVEGVVCPDDSRSIYCWMGHEMVAELLLPVADLVRGRSTLKRTAFQMLKFAGEMTKLKDATFEVTDPMPWWWMYQVYYPWFFLTSLVTGRRWTRVNVSTTRVFESF